MTESRHLNDAAGTNARLRAIIRRTRIDLRYLHDDRSRAHVVAACAGAARVLDIGASMREAGAALTASVETLDVNDYGDYPDYIADLCGPLPDWMAERYDAAIALAILEHAYDPAAAVANLRAVLRPGGRLFLYVPWIWRHHGPPDLSFQDYQRLSRDGMAYLLRDFEEVTLYPLRGKYSAMLNLMKLWKGRVERRFGGRINRLLDARVSDRRNTLQSSGFFAEARKPG